MGCDNPAGSSARPDGRLSPSRDASSPLGAARRRIGGRTRVSRQRPSEGHAGEDQKPQDGTRDGFVTYDELRGADLDAARWSPARLPFPTGGEHIPLDPNAEVAVGEGEVRVTIPRFSLSNDKFQAADSPKYLVVSTREFELPADRPATFAVDLAVENIGGEPGDYRRGMAAFHVFDLDASKRVFAVVGASTPSIAASTRSGIRRSDPAAGGWQRCSRRGRRRFSATGPQQLSGAYDRSPRSQRRPPRAAGDRGLRS